MAPEGNGRTKFSRGRKGTDSLVFGRAGFHCKQKTGKCLLALSRTSTGTFSLAMPHIVLSANQWPSVAITPAESLRLQDATLPNTSNDGGIKRPTCFRKWGTPQPMELVGSSNINEFVSPTPGREATLALRATTGTAFGSQKNGWNVAHIATEIWQPLAVFARMAGRE